MIVLLFKAIFAHKDPDFQRLKDESLKIASCPGEACSLVIPLESKQIKDLYSGKSSGSCLII